MKTYIPKADDIKRKWYVVDLDGATLGRAAVKVADILRGKNKPSFTPHLDAGDYIIAINASKIVMSGNKERDKKYYRYSGYPGGLKETSFGQIMQKNSPAVFIHAVKGMLPKNRLGRKLINKLHVYADANHKHQAQEPESLKLFD
ncbi:MAG: 50S ribosomal protein L13 [Candidatus Zixiibacteriota bacterium]|nr:MAG: 50S ribosomal protein L13 [candidate division Zixibacteria bacterium]HHI03433.1 50S ribosomal protein L13 [candidate division Zixibacteria bacterium]